MSLLLSGAGKESRITVSSLSTSQMLTFAQTLAVLPLRDVFDGPLDAVAYDTTGKTITKIQCWGKGGNAGSGIGGGGGAYTELTVNLPSPMPTTIYLDGPIDEMAVWDGIPGDANAFVVASAGIDSGRGGLASDCIGDLAHSGGDGGVLGGGRAGTPTADGASNSPGGTGPGDGGDLPSGTGKPGRIVITYT